MVFTHTCVQNILMCICRQYKQWLFHSTDIQTFSLANCVKMCAVVLANQPARFRCKLRRSGNALQLVFIGMVPFPGSTMKGVFR